MGSHGAFVGCRYRYTPDMGLKGHTGKIRDMTFAPDSSTLITTSGDKTMRLWDVNTGTEQKKLPAPEDAINPLVAANQMFKLLEQGILPKETG